MATVTAPTVPGSRAARAALTDHPAMASRGLRMCTSVAFSMTTPADGMAKSWRDSTGCCVALPQGSSVIELSLGTPVLAGEAHSQFYEEIARRALSVGSLLVAPAG